MHLSDMQCRTAKPRLKPYKISDGGGLYLEVSPNGSKYWRQKYRLSGKEKRIAHGVYPAVSLLEARRKREQIKTELKNGFDPVLTKLELKQTAVFDNAQTFESIALEWHSKNLEHWDPRYAQTILHRLKKYVLDDLGTYPVKELKPIIILACLQKIEKTAPDMARRIKQIISHIFKYAIATDRTKIDFTYGLEVALKKYKKGHFAAISVDELAELLSAMYNHKARLYRQTFLALQLMLLTFVRTSELIGAKWNEIDFKNSMWVIPGERMKKGKSHLVPLSKQAIAVLSELKYISGSKDHIFPGIAKNKPTMSEGTILVALKRMGYKNRMTGHGFRSLAMGILKEKLGFSHELVDRQLAHVRKSGNDRAYDRAEFLPQRILMMQSYADYIDETVKTIILR